MKYFILVFLLSLKFSFSQVKIDYEKKIDISEVPEKAINDLQSTIKDLSKVKWYYQKDDGVEVYEAKFRYNKLFYSIEFSMEGKIKNVEVLCQEKKLNTHSKNEIHASLSELFTDYKILKIQKEYLGHEESLLSIINSNNDGKLKINYEVEVNAKINKQRKLYEIILDDNFKVTRKRILITQSTDVLDY